MSNGSNRRSKGAQQLLRGRPPGPGVVRPHPWRGLVLALLVLLAVWPPAAHAEPAYCEALIASEDQAGQAHTPCRDPDLIPANAMVNATDERFPTQMCGYAMNVGRDSQTPATGFYVTVFVDGFAEAAQQVRDVLNTGQASAKLCWNATLAAGWHRFALSIDPPRSDADQGDVLEADESNNVMRDAWFFVRATPQPNLRLASFQVTPTVGRPGTNQFFIADVLNAGSAPSNATQVEFRDDNGVLARETIPALRGGESYRAWIYNLTDKRPAGNWTGIATLDPDNATVLDCRNVRFTQCRNFTVQPHPAPDLVVLNVTLQGSFEAHRGILVNVQVRNVGDRSADVAQVRAYDGDRPLANATRGLLAPGEIMRAQLLVVLPEGERTLRLVADPDGLVVERNEANNAWAQNVTIASSNASGAMPNLVVERFDALPHDPRPGETIMVSALVRNLGDAPSNATQLRIEADGKELATKDVPSIPASKSYNVVYYWGSAAEGEHQLIARADPDATFEELSRDDNALALDFTVAAPATPEPQPETPPTPTGPPDTGEPTPPTPETPPTPKGPAFTVTSFDVVGPNAAGKFYLGVAVRNPSLDTLGRISVEFRVDGKVVGDKLINSVPGAGSAASRTDEFDPGPGPHSASVSLRVLGSTDAPTNVEKSFDAPTADTPAPAWVLLVGLGAAAALLRRPRR